MNKEDPASFNIRTLYSGMQIDQCFIAWADDELTFQSKEPSTSRGCPADDSSPLDVCEPLTSLTLQPSESSMPWRGWLGVEMELAVDQC